MLKKVYSELMILGLIGLASKILKEVAPIDSYSKPIVAFQVAFQVADLIIFSFAIVLILQATCIFFQLHEHSQRANLPTTEDLAEELDKQNDPRRPRCWFGKRTSAATLEKEIKYRLLRHTFLLDLELGYDLVKLLVVSGWTLVVVNVLALVYIHHCVQQLLVHAGYSQDRTKLAAKLREIARYEDTAWGDESAEDALETMHNVHKAREENEAKRKKSRAYARVTCACS
ncbi:hypothetical protein PHYPSEUDO_008244 [Phytophthora pseudosyringae]|uniref:Uncharacterized protein n=1 Tax=Phytophthora pseudosyringae TaxID=221518 RepID=A0A8T1VEX1_9STRA|nr:hypothetical protein PHYPSEUDO_008244 [Phytophthora pseudosyringae]